MPNPPRVVSYLICFLNRTDIAKGLPSTTIGGCRNMVRRIPHQNQNWPSPSQQSQRLWRNIGGQPISVRSRIWSSLHSFTSFESESIHHLPLHGRNEPYRCGTATFGCGIVLGISSHAQQDLRCYYRQIAQQYAAHTKNGTKGAVVHHSRGRGSI